MADTVPLGDVAEVKRSFLGSEVMLLKADGSVTWTTPAQFLTTTARTREVARVLERVLAERAARVSLDTQGTR
jgi:DNA-binding transcriptional regulator/RsmH inhibitor MraZ